MDVPVISFVLLGSQFTELHALGHVCCDRDILIVFSDSSRLMKDWKIVNVIAIV